MIIVNCLYEGKDSQENIRRWERPSFQYDDRLDPNWEDLNRQIDIHYAIWLEKYKLAPMTATFETQTEDYEEE